MTELEKAREAAKILAELEYKNCKVWVVTQTTVEKFGEVTNEPREVAKQFEKIYEKDRIKVNDEKFLKTYDPNEAYALAQGLLFLKNQNGEIE